MSRAPAPMKNEPSTTNGVNAAGSPGGGTAAPMHAMQHMYTNMQQPQYSNGSPYPHSGQNAMAQGAPGGMTNGYPGNGYPGNTMNGYPSPSPSAYDSHYSTNGYPGSSPNGYPGHSTNGYPGNSTHHVPPVDFRSDIVAQHRHQQMQQKYNPRMNDPRTAANQPMVNATDAGYPYAHRGSYGKVGLHSDYMPPYQRQQTKSVAPRRVPPPISNRQFQPPSSRTNSNMATNFTSNAATRSALKEMVAEHVPSTRSIKNLIDDRTPSTRVLKSMIDDSVGEAVDRHTSKLNSPATGASFHTKPQDEQRRIVGSAVRSVMENYTVRPISKQANTMGSTSSSYPTRDRAHPPVGSSYQSRHGTESSYPVRDRGRADTDSSYPSTGRGRGNTESSHSSSGRGHSAINSGYPSGGRGGRTQSTRDDMF
jgi:hypothetical protein